MLPRQVSPHAWIEIAMSSQEENPAKRGRIDSPPPTLGLGTMPELPRHEAIECRGMYELLQIIQKANIASVLSQHMQQAQNHCYDIIMPSDTKSLTEEWVKEHVHALHMDDDSSLEQLVRSVVNNAPGQKLEKLLAWKNCSEKFYGYELRVPVKKRDNTVYQDGSAVKGESVKLFHSTRQGRLHNMLKNGVQASIPSHETEGLWTNAVATLDGYDWGRTGLETLYGCRLELQAPKTLWGSHNLTGALHHNKKIAASGHYGSFRWVVHGRGSALPVMITAVTFVLPSPRQLEFTLQLRTAIKNCVNWSFGCSWSNEDIVSEHAASTSEPKTIGEVKNSKPRWLGKIVSDTINLVERRICYTWGASKEAAMKRTYEPHDDFLNVLVLHHDISEAAVSLSADIARVLYPLLSLEENNRVAFWRAHLSWDDVPFPLMSFLHAKFSNTNWCFIFHRESFFNLLNDQVHDTVKDTYRSRTKAIIRKVRETVTGQGVQSTSVASSSTMESVEAATMDDMESVDAATCFYRDFFLQCQ